MPLPGETLSGCHAVGWHGVAARQRTERFVSVAVGKIGRHLLTRAILRLWSSAAKQHATSPGPAKLLSGRKDEEIFLQSADFTTSNTKASASTHCNIHLVAPGNTLVSVTSSTSMTKSFSLSDSLSLLFSGSDMEASLHAESLDDDIVVAKSMFSYN